MASPEKSGKRLTKFWNLARFMLGTLPGWRWKLPSTLLIGSGDIAVLILIPLVSARIVNALVARSWPDFRYNLILLGVLTFAQMGVGLAHRYVFLNIDERSGNILRQTIVDTVFRKSLRFFDKHWVGDIVSRAINDSAILKGFITGVLLQLIYDIASLAVVVVILVKMNPVLAVLTIATAPVTLLYGKMVTPRLEAATLRVRENVAAVTSHLQSWLSRPFALKAHALEPEASRRFGLRNDELMKNSVGFGLLGAKIGAINATLLGIPSLLIFGYGGYITFKGDLSIGALFAFMTFSSYFNGPIQRVINIVVATLPTLYPVYDRVQQFLTPEDVEQIAARPAVLPPVKQIRADDLTFNFEQGQTFNLVVPSFTARRGEIVGIAGPNGSGKSTLGRLLAGIYQPQSGTVTVELDGDGRDEAAVNRRHLLGFLPQETAVFDGTLRENITLFAASPDQERLARIGEELGMNEWINSLPQGLETEINAGLATKFSGGQLQKLGLSRVLYRDPPILLLDEPSTSLDQSAQVLTDQLVNKARANHIVIIITHSSETLAVCDRVYQLKPQPGASKSFECVERVPQLEMAGGATGLPVSTAG
ncbi:MAG TPA: ABC transporter ATP-binding protein [Pyrinomonadaceae bacterium]|nr:ABC transporter ATP-binding protein [Pyrinomonadaceae bacterium]